MYLTIHLASNTHCRGFSRKSGNVKNLISRVLNKKSSLVLLSFTSTLAQINIIKRK